ncbi:unnamed protein product [Paramecium sonneborni]|uniref:Vacuolar sorting receptor thioredoxin-like domain-containing protein n=1 Tax=Paramecium sonneborni TaxID=65129 RepID=A0A8S1QBX4_9CILI|nr:unnamed protein product [Paramecium sonneborni]
MLYFFIIAIALVKNAKIDVNLTIGLDFQDNSYMEFFNNFSSHYSEFKENGLNLNIAQHLLPCYSCNTRHQFQKSEKNCLGGGRYCQYSDYVSGQIILKELLFQQCVLDVLPQHYFNYTIYFGKQCKKSTMVDCSKNYFKNNNITTDPIDECVMNSFNQQDVQEDIKTNKILDKYKDMQYNQTFYSLYLDSQDLSKSPYNEFLQQLCQKFVNASLQSCGQSVNIETSSNQKDNNKTPTNQKENNSLEQVFLFIFALIILILMASGGWTLLNKIQFGSRQAPKSRITIPKLEGDHIIQEDDI